MWVSGMGSGKENYKMVSVLTEAEQRKRLLTEQRRCELKNSRESDALEGLHCNRTWDNIVYWSDTPAGHVASQPCPGYINMFDQAEFVTRHCTDNGTWWVSPDTGHPWSNYSQCFKSTNKEVPQLIQEHMPGINMMYTVGYSLSLTALILALAIMIYFKRLHCPRNLIHMNMFLAFGVRAILSLMKNVLLVNHLGFANDVNQTGSEISFVDEGTHWECKLFFTTFYYAIFSSVMWLFNEGLYLQLILSVAIFSYQTKLRWFVLLGWGVPLLFVVPWAICRIYFDDMLKLTKSTLILIPLFAVYYMVFMLLPDDVSATVELLKTSVEMLFNSFQGLLVAMLFCFLNQEVQQEVRTKFRRRSLQNTGNRRVSMFRPLFVHSSSADHDIQSHDLVAKQHNSHANVAIPNPQLGKGKSQSRKTEFKWANKDLYVSRTISSTSNGSTAQKEYLNFDRCEDSIKPLIEPHPSSVVTCKEPASCAITTDLSQQSLTTCSENLECKTTV